VFETTAAQINAGAVYIGELEGRVKTLVDSVAGQSVVWIITELQETLFAGQHTRSPQGLLDALLPHIESGAIALVAEVTPAAAELLMAARPRVKSAFELVRIRPLDDPETIAVAIAPGRQRAKQALRAARRSCPRPARPSAPARPSRSSTRMKPRVKSVPPRSCANSSSPAAPASSCRQRMSSSRYSTWRAARVRH